MQHLYLPDPLVPAHIVRSYDRHAAVIDKPAGVLHAETLLLPCNGTDLERTVCTEMGVLVAGGPVVELV